MLGLSAGLHYPKFTSSQVIIDVARKGWIQGAENSNFTAAHQIPNPGEIEDIATGDKTIQYVQLSGRGGTTHRFQRIYFYFDVSSVSGITTGSLQLELTDTPDADIRLIESTAFGGNGGTALSAFDYYTNSDYTVEYSAQYEVDGTAGIIQIPLTSYGITAVNDTDYFVTALIGYDYDEQITNPGSATNVRTTVDLNEPIQLILE